MTDTMPPLMTEEDRLKAIDTTQALGSARDWGMHEKLMYLTDLIESHVRQQFADAISAEREACAKLCEEIVTYPAGHRGQFEGYGNVRQTRSGEECAAAIRSRGQPPQASNEPELDL